MTPKEELVQRTMTNSTAQTAQSSTAQQSADSMAQPVEDVYMSSEMDQKWWEDKWLVLTLRALSHMQEVRKRAMRAAAKGQGGISVQQMRCAHPPTLTSRGGNQYGHWEKCGMCGLRLSYESKLQKEKMSTRVDKAIRGIAGPGARRFHHVTRKGRVDTETQEWEVLEELASAEAQRQTRHTAAKSKAKSVAQSAGGDLKALTDAVTELNRSIQMMSQSQAESMKQLAAHTQSQTEGLKQLAAHQTQTVGAIQQAVSTLTHNPIAS